METSNIIQIFSFFLSLLVSASGTNYSSNHAFIQCLQNHSNPSNPISAVLYIQNMNASYSYTLQKYINNLMYNETYTPKPLYILAAKHVSHIRGAIICAKKHGIQMKIRSGGHDFEGISYWSEIPDFFILDIFNFKSIHVDIQDESAWVQAGATIGELCYRIAERSASHAFPAGVCPTVGLGGHFSGGGYGNMMRKYGLTVDNIIDVEIVDVNGNHLDRKSMGEDLFWAITGGGASSYAVVLSYKIKLVRVPDKVTVSKITRTNHNQVQFTNLIHQYLKIADKMPENLFIRLTLDVINGTNRATFRVLFLGNQKQLLSIMNEKFHELEFRRTDGVHMSWVESVLFWTDFPIGTPLNALLSRIPQILTHQKRKSDYLKNPIPKQGLEHIFKKMMHLQIPTLAFNPYGGKMAKISPSEKPFPHRGNVFKLLYSINWEENGKEAANRHEKLIKEMYDCMTPYVTMNPREAFVNYRDLDIGINHNGGDSYLEGLVYGLSYFKGNFERLVKIKTEVDPHNFFRNEQSIPVLPKRE